MTKTLCYKCPATLKDGGSATGKASWQMARLLQRVKRRLH